MNKSKKWISYWRKRKSLFIEECNFERNKFLRDIAHPKATQERVLKDIIQISRNSLYWKEQNYLSINDVNSFREVLPIMQYDNFIPMLEKEVQIKGAVLTCSPILRWLKTSGTTGVPKKVPYSLHWILNYRIPAMKAMWANYYIYHPEILDNPYATLDTQTVREDTNDFLQGVPYQAVSNRHPRLNIFDWNPPWFEAPWFNNKVPSTYDDKMYYRIRHLIGKKMHFISAINPSTLLAFHDHIEINKEKLVQEVANGTINGKSFEEPNYIESQRLANIFNKKKFTLVDIWPSLNLYSCWFSASAGLYQNSLQQVLGDVHKLPFMSCGTEGVVTIPIDNSVYSQPLAINQAFYEFVEEDIDLESKLKNGEKVQTLLFNEIIAGKNYHLIMSQATGLFRLWTGDIYHVDRVVNGMPWVHFLHRVGIFHSFTGEKLTEFDVTSAL
ncbi:MAG TPA: GH3 auxin-responsive promoter family protein, partial [Aquella sp.]|nr:GH3 auxin-responsive promoter family protein [Aquella sp.]